jgi:hypothetical protein
LLQTTKEAVSAGDDKRDNHPVAFADRGDLGTRFHHFPHKFMAENIAMVRAGDLSAVKMQIGTADRRRGDAQNNIVRRLKSRVRHGVDTNMMGTVISECFHCVFS